MMTEPRTIDEELADIVGQYWDDPLGFVMMAYPWRTEPSIQLCKLPIEYADRFPADEYGPDLWACQFLDRLGEEIRKRGFDVAVSKAVDAVKMSVVSGHGIGKSAMCAWLVDFIMSTRPGSQGTVTANTAEQLASRTWAQIAKWTRLCITAHWFDITSGRGSMRMVSKERPSEWFCEAKTCREEKSEAFAGQHAPVATSFYIFDESSAVPNIFDEVSEGGLTDGEPMKFAFGNGTRNTGWFKDTFKNPSWINFHVDSREVQITNKEQYAAWIKEHGIDSDYIKVRVRGMFPSQSIKQFISSDDVDAAIGRALRKEQYIFAPKILTLDNAWQGDDEGVIGLRQGLRYETLKTFAKNDNDVQIATLLAQLEDEHKADAVFIDAGYGTGVVSIGRALGRNWVLVWFGSASPDPGYLNMRAFIWGQARDWLKAGGVLDSKDHVLYRDLTGPETVPRMDGKIQLESKEDMKRRDTPSPGRGDALALSFAFPVVHKALAGISSGTGQKSATEHNPYDALA